MIFRLYGKNISTKESSAFRTTHLPTMYGNLSAVLTINLRWIAHRRQITSNTATIMFWFLMDPMKLQSTLMTVLKVAFSLNLRFLNRQV